MKSPKQARPKSTPLKVTLAAGVKLPQPMTSGRITPTAKLAPKLCCGS